MNLFSKKKKNTTPKSPVEKIKFCLFQKTAYGLRQ